jgi:RHS repeat-associated protein
MKPFSSSLRLSFAWALILVLTLQPILFSTDAFAQRSKSTTSSEATSGTATEPTGESGGTPKTPATEEVILPSLDSTEIDPEASIDQPKDNKSEKEDEDETKKKEEESTEELTPEEELDGAMEMMRSSSSGDDIAAPLVDLAIDPYKNIGDLHGEHTVSEFSGDLNYSYPIAVPPGRNGLTPSVALTYNSSNRDGNSAVGYGWSLEMPSISRYSRTGVEQLYTGNNFTSPFAGGNGELTAESVDSNGYGTYIPKVVNGKTKHEFLTDDTWQVTTAEGSIYRFGIATDASDRIQNDSGNRIHTWFLSEVEDLNGNKITYEYRKQQGQAYPKTIKWGDATNPYELHFLPTSHADLPDLPSYSRGFAVTERMNLITSIEVIDPQIPTNKTVYELEYHQPLGKYDYPTLSYLKQITRKGVTASETLSEEPTVFEYDAYDGSRSFTVDQPYLISGDPLVFGESDCYSLRGSTKWIYADYNSDGWEDLVSDIRYINYGGSIDYSEEAWLNNGDGTWTHFTESNPDNHVFASCALSSQWGESSTASPIFSDMNGDNDPSLCLKLVMSTGGTDTGDFSCPTNEEGATFWLDGKAGSTEYEHQFFDANGDGLLDAFKATTSGSWGTGAAVVFNDAQGYPLGSQWDISPDTGSSISHFDRGFALGDVNGDGLDDFVFRFRHEGYWETIDEQKALLASPIGWIDVTEDIAIPISLWYFVCGERDGCTNTDPLATKASLYDLNRDGLPDILWGNGKVYLNNGHGWENNFTIIDPYWAPSNYGHDQVQYQNSFHDLNKDGIWERTRTNTNGGSTQLFQNDRPEPPILTNITTPLKAEIEVEYTPASSYKNPDNTPANFDLPIPRLTVSKLTTSGAYQPTSETTYHYAGGKLHRPNIVKGVQQQEMVGFATVTKTLPNGAKITTDYNQGEEASNFAAKGQPKNQQIHSAGGNLLTETRNQYTIEERLTGESYQSLQTKSLEITFNPNNAGENKSKGATFSYDQYGNLTEQVDFGEVTPSGPDGDFTDTGTDKITTTIEYAENTAKHILSLPKRTETKDHNNTVIAESKTYYDGTPGSPLPLGQIEKGNTTKTETLVTTTPSDQYITQTAEYNSFGLPTKVTDANGNDTTITYDSFNLYPATIRNAKDHLVVYYFNYLYGIPEQQNDPNGTTNRNTYDALGRLIETEVGHLGFGPEYIPVGVTATYDYDYAAQPVKITATAKTGTDDINGNPIEITSVRYVDGFGRQIQTKTEWEGADTYLTTGTVYDESGNVKHQHLPQLKTGNTYDPNFDETEPGTTNTYDALGRPTATTVPHGAGDIATTTTKYDRWTATVTDARGFKKDFINDARGNLVQVNEYLTAGPSATPAGSTIYTYNPLNQLTQITDAKGNIKAFSYDLAGRKLTESDFHDSQDSTYSNWSYTYDNNGNLLTTTDAKSQTITYTYDELNRPLTEDHSTTAGIEVIFAYDTAFLGKGRLASVTTESDTEPIVTKSYHYDTLGNVTKETKTIDSTDYITEYSYDLLGNPLTTIYPDSDTTKAIYGYNNAGQLEQVQYEQDSTTTDLVTNLDYSPTGAPTTIAYANGVITTHTYDINYLYFLTQKQTVKDSTDLQNLAYQFDKSGNITQINDTSITQTAKVATYTYDGLSRLLTATIDDTSTNDNDYSRSYTYDIIGNILNKSDIGTYTYAETDYASPHAVTQAGSTNYTYDNNGNLSSDSIWNHSWDAKDRLLSSTNPTTSTTVSYTYDEAGSRVTKTNEQTGKVTTYINDLFDIEDDQEKLFFFASDLKLATLEASTSAQTPCTVPQTGDWNITTSCTIQTFETAPADVTIAANTTLTVANTGVLEVDLNNHSLTVSDTAGLLIEQGGAIAQTGTLTPPQGTPGEQSLIFHHSDHLSGAAIDTDDQGTILQTTDYYPFGDSRIEESTGSYENDYTYTGKERDEDTELLYYEARYYDSAIGRFISLDPWGGDINNPQTFNKYAYTLNNPMNAIDPDGRLTIFIHGTGNQEGMDDENYRNKVTSDLGDSSNTAFKWSGGNSVAAREEGGASLAEFINSYEFSEGEALNIVAHSHGGNVAIEAINQGLNKQVNNLVTLGTPVREEQFLWKADKVDNFINVYNRRDNVQTGGKFISSFPFSFNARMRHSLEQSTEIHAKGGGFFRHTASYHSWLRSDDAWENHIKPQLIEKGMLEYDTNDDGTIKKNDDGSPKTRSK